MRRRLWQFSAAGLVSLIMLLSVAAWFQVQSLRWGYQVHQMRSKLDEMEKREQAMDMKLQRALTLARLDELAKNRYKLRVPAPTQVVMLTDG